MTFNCHFLLGSLFPSLNHQFLKKNLQRCRIFYSLLLDVCFNCLFIPQIFFLNVFEVHGETTLLLISACYLNYLCYWFLLFPISIFIFYVTRYLPNFSSILNASNIMHFNLRYNFSKTNSAFRVLMSCNISCWIFKTLFYGFASLLCCIVLHYPYCIIWIVL